jgi:hypothetical protein
MAKRSRIDRLARQHWIGEAVRYWGESAGDDPKPLDLSSILALFRACDPESPDYDEDFHRRLFEEKPHWFGPDGLPKPAGKPPYGRTSQRTAR